MNPRIVLIDHFDSFVHTIAYYVGGDALKAKVVRSTEATPDLVRALQPDALILGPGPGTPSQSSYIPLLQDLMGELPILGICLGHQAIAEAFGTDVIRAKQAVHGRTSTVTHDGGGAFQNLPPRLNVTRYHSLVIDEATLPACFEVSARSVDDEEVMGMRHKQLPIESVQFHPESIGTDFGRKMMMNFIIEYIGEDVEHVVAAG